MKFTDIFIRRPVLAISISLLIVLLGLQAISKMQVREYPTMTNTVVTVSTSYYGANADLIQGFITQPIEQAIAQADNIDFITSQSYMGRSQVSVYMKLNTDPNGAADTACPSWVTVPPSLSGCSLRGLRGWPGRKGAR